MSDIFPQGHIFAGTLSGNGTKTYSKQTTLPSNDYPVGREYWRESTPQITYNINYKTVNADFINSLIDAIKTPGNIYTAYYYKNNNTQASQETASITGVLLSYTFSGIEGTNYYTAQITIQDNSYIARIGD